MRTVESFHSSTRGTRNVSARRKPTPSYLLHRQSGRARAVWTDQIGVRQQRLLPGKYDSPESRTAFARLQLELATAPHRPPGPDRPELSVNEVLLAFLVWAEGHYRTPAGEPTTEVGELKRSLKPVRELYGATPAAEFGPKKLAAARQGMIDLGWCRTLTNRRVDRVKRAFKWAAAEELAPVAVYQSLRTLPGLQKGRTAARESDPVEPVDPAHVAAVLPFLSRHTRAMVELQRLTGMRPGEVCRLRLAEVDSTHEVWVYRPEKHKTAHRGKRRVIPLGPRARAVLIEFLTGDDPPPMGWEAVDLNDPTARVVMADAYEEAGRVEDAMLLRDTDRQVVRVGGCVVDPDAPVFSPAREREERFRRWRSARKSKVPPSQQNRRKAKPARVPSAEYHPHALTDSVARACKKAGIDRWHPNQLRHTFATQVRKQHGLEAAQVLLGHARADVTQVYAERNEALAVAVAAKIG
jgi:integrase